MTPASIHYPDHAVRRLRERQEPWATAWKSGVVAAAAPWLAMDLPTVWGLVFGPRLTRAWQVWSSGHCPVCQMSLPEYSWQMDAHARPWKTRCPGCETVFPTNDFEAYHRCGLDAAGLFDPELADRLLLVNPAHPDPADPRHTWGVDDGNGWTDGTDRWRFVAAYLIYGQWKQRLVGGISRCASAWLATGDPAYAHRALIMLDRLADVYPQMDFAAQGLVYEGGGHVGYLSVWHDACEEIAELTLAYDAVRPALPTAQPVVDAIAAQRQRFPELPAKPDVAAIQANIESNLLRETVANAVRIRSNFPRTDLALIRILTVLGEPADLTAADERLHPMLQQATAIDGVTGEKGLNAYASWTASGVFQYMAGLAMTDLPRFREILTRHPRIHDGVRFFLDTWCLQGYYPSCGDAGAFMLPDRTVAGLDAESYAADSALTTVKIAGGSPLPRPSPHALLWTLYEATGDIDMLRISRIANDSADGDLRFGLLGDPTPAQRAAYHDALATHGADLTLGSVDKAEWHLAILRSGHADHARALWLDYDTGRSHHHFDGLNLGLFAYGLDLLPDFGYPPTGYGGHETKEAMWYVHTAAHNTVVVDAACQPGPHWTKEILAAGTMTAWHETDWARIMRCDMPDVYPQTRQYERTLSLVDIDDTSCYIVDIFRVIGGQDHAKFTHSGAGTLATPALTCQPADIFIADALQRDLRVDPAPPAAWLADFHITDPHNHRRATAPSDVHLRIHDLTADATAGTLESWVNDGGYNVSQVIWIPTIMTRRQQPDGDLCSTFVAVIEPTDGPSRIRSIERTALCTADGTPLGHDHVALRITLTDGRTDHHLLPNTGPAHTPDAAVAPWTPDAPTAVPAWHIPATPGTTILRHAPDGPAQTLTALP